MISGTIMLIAVYAARTCLKDRYFHTSQTDHDFPERPLSHEYETFIAPEIPLYI